MKPALDMKSTDLNNWLASYGRAWEQKDAEAFVALFTATASYYWTPFEEPKVGRQSIGEAFEAAVARQSHIRFRASTLSGERAHGIAHWQCSFERLGGNYIVELDGISLMDFSEDGLCRVFREWWHSNEHGPG